MVYRWSPVRVQEQVEKVGRVVKKIWRDSTQPCDRNYFDLNNHWNWLWTWSWWCCANVDDYDGNDDVDDGDDDGNDGNDDVYDVDDNKPVVIKGEGGEGG